ncbi:MAG: hypothetical protein O7C62_00560 [Rickettsia endosymbiont of Ixodes persulcatus]|nr:hypothetical protein [Rickettsia endosymbiont of Ixodes persulcatus]
MTDQGIVKINASLRENVGTGPSRALRLSGEIPAVVYGKGRESLSISLSGREFLSKYRSAEIALCSLYIMQGQSFEYLSNEV